MPYPARTSAEVSSADESAIPPDGDRRIWTMTSSGITLPAAAAG
jgi:hypothetical protein